MINLAKLNLLFFLIILCTATAGCSKPESEPVSTGENDTGFQVDFMLPVEWEAFEVADNRYGGKDTSIITNEGSLVTVHSTNTNTFDEENAKEYFLKLHVSSSLPDGEIRESAKIDFGEVDREGFQGLFAKVKTPEPNLADYTIEVFFPSTASAQRVVVYNTPEGLRKNVNEKQNDFLKMMVQ
ncbi:MAG: hypothetical protein ACRBCS_07935 [Cellvibrionaceae bacterium]